MNTFAVVEQGVVTNIIVGVEPEVVAANPGRYVAYTVDAPARIGDHYDAATGIFTTPVTVAP